MCWEHGTQICFFKIHCKCNPEVMFWAITHFFNRLEESEICLQWHPHHYWHTHKMGVVEFAAS